MRYLIFLVLSVFSVSANSNHGSEQSYSTDIVGSWMLMDHGYMEAYTISLISFTKEGRKCVVATDYSLSSEGQVQTTYWDNKWKLEDGYLITTITKSSSNYTPPGYVIRDKILLLKADELNVLMESDGDYKPDIEKHVRLKGEDPARICSLIDKRFNT